MSSRISLLSLICLALFAIATGCSQELISRNDELRREGVQRYNMQSYADAAGSFRAAARLDPRDYKALYYLGSSYEKMGQNHQAIEAYKSSLDAQTRTLPGQEDEAGRLRTLDALASLIGRIDSRDAETNLVEQTAKTKQSAEQFFLLAKIYRFRGDADMAVDNYNRAMLKNPKDFALTKEYGLYLEQLGQSQKAQYALQKAYAMRNTDGEVETALRRLGVVPGPALKDERDLVSPPVPKGPIPQVKLEDLGLGNLGGSRAQPARSVTPAQPVAPSPAPAPETVAAPRD